MPDPGAALMTALLHRANPADLQNLAAILAVAGPIGIRAGRIGDGNREIA